MILISMKSKQIRPFSNPCERSTYFMSTIHMSIYFSRSKLAVTHHYYSFYMHTFFIVIIVVVNPTPVVIVVINVRWRFRLSFFDTRIDNHSVAVRRSLPCKLFRRFKLNSQRRNLRVGFIHPQREEILQ